MISELYNSNVERAVLSSLFFDPNLIGITQLKKDDFYLPFHQNFFNIMKKLYKEEKPIEDEFLKKELESINQFDEYKFIELLSANPISKISFYEEALIELSNKRKLFNLQEHIKENITTLSSTQIQALLINDNTISLPQSGLPPLYELENIEPKMPEFWTESFLPIPKREITLISADGGSGKSFLVLLEALMLTHTHSLKVFAWFSEDEIGITSHRARMLKHLYHELSNTSITIAGKETSPKAFVRKERGTYQATDFFYQLKSYLKHFDVIILDPLVAFFGEDENSNTEASFFLGLLNEWCVKENKSIIVIHHHNKEDKFRGASAFVNSVRMHYSLKKIEDNEEERILKMEKTNHWKGKKEFHIRLFGEKPIIKNYITKQEIEEIEKNYHCNKIFDITIEEESVDFNELKKELKKLSIEGFNFE